MAQFCGHVDGQILWVTKTRPLKATGEIIEIPTDLFHVEHSTLITDYEIWRNTIVPKRRTINVSDLKIALVTPWDIPCGIATYSKSLADKYRAMTSCRIFAEGECWERGKPLSALARELRLWQPDVIHIQHEYGLFPDARHWLSLLSQLAGIPVWVTLHSVYDHRDKTICEAAIPNIIVHTESAKRALLAKGITRQPHVITHGCHYNADAKKLWNLYRSPHTVVQFGFGFRYKGWEHSLQAIAEIKPILPDVFFTGIFSLTNYNSASHNQYLNELREMIRSLNIEENAAIIPGFMAEDALESYLRTSAVGLFPYESAPEHEVFGASGAVRMAMANRLPVVGSAMHHFDDLEGVIPRPGSTKETVAAILNLFCAPVAARQVECQDAFLQRNGWQHIAEQHLALFSERKP